MLGQLEPGRRAKLSVTVEAGGAKIVGSGAHSGGTSFPERTVRDVREKHRLSLPEASKYVKEHHQS